jgi:quercetin dioxygenase-like cupin family protein
MEELIAALAGLGFKELPQAEGLIHPRETGNAFARICPNVLSTYITYGPGEARSDHSHPELRVTFVRSGEATLTKGGQEERLKPGDVVILPPGIRHSLKIGEAEPFSICELVVESNATA